MIAFMVRCKCGAAARVEVPTVREEKTRRVGGIIGVPGSASTERYTVKRAVWGEREFLYASINNSTRAERQCWACGKALKIDQLHGVRSPEHVCDSRCEASKGPQCECACGGANHGKAWA